jgi:hypothetical protein
MLQEVQEVLAGLMTILVGLALVLSVSWQRLRSVPSRSVPTALQMRRLRERMAVFLANQWLLIASLLWAGVFLLLGLLSVVGAVLFSSTLCVIALVLLRLGWPRAAVWFTLVGRLVMLLWLNSLLTPEAGVSLWAFGQYSKNQEKTNVTHYCLKPVVMMMAANMLGDLSAREHAGLVVATWIFLSRASHTSAIAFFIVRPLRWLELSV